MKSKTIGIKANYYNQQRNFTGLPFKDYKFEKTLDSYRIIAFVYFKFLKKTHPQWLNLFSSINTGTYDLMHFWNAVSLAKKPWVTTFEHYLPRGASQIGVKPNEDRYIRKALTALASTHCKQIIAISNHAKNAQINYLANYHDKAVSQKIIDKIIIQHPAQKVLVESVQNKQYTEHLNLILVGAAFFLKGGLETLQIVDELLKKGLKIKLVIVSKLEYGDFASRSTKADLEEAKFIISKHPEITHYFSKPNPEVLELIKEADITLLPSYGETYGYSVLEAQACGCPVISTNGAALSEINNNDCGWVIEVPLIKNRSVPEDDKAKEKFKTIVKNELRTILTESIGNSELLRSKGGKCIEQIRKYHSIEQATETITKIYDSALSR